MGVTQEKRLDAKFRKRLKRRLHYGDMADLDAPSLPLTELSVDYFHDSAPGKLGHVDLEAASNIVKQNKVTPCSMVVSVLYARRLRQRNRQYLDSMSSSDVFFISMMMASKYMYDEGTDDEVYNDEWAASIDQEVGDVNKMEMDFLQAMDWRLFVRPDEFEETLEAIEKRLALKEGLKRGWFTYAELDVLMGPDLIGSVCCGIASEVSKFLATVSAAYLTGLLSMLGSVALATQVSGPLSSATVALMALHSSPSLVSPLGNDLNLLSISSHRRVGLCGSQVGSDQCQGIAEISNSNLMVELHGQEINNTDFMEGKSKELSSNMLEHVLQLQDTGGSFQNDNPRNEHVKSGKIKLESDRDLEWEEEENNGLNTGVKTSDEEVKVSSSSLWSLWFLDSLLSQIWSLSSLKSQGVRKRSGTCFRRRPCTKSYENDIVNVQDIKVLPDRSPDDLCPSVCKSLLLRAQLIHGNTMCSENCFSNYHSGSATKAIQGNKNRYYPSQSTYSAKAMKDCSKNSICKSCRQISLGLCSAYNQDFQAMSDQHSSSKALNLGTEFPIHDLSDPTCSGYQVCEHQAPNGASLCVPGGKINSCPQDNPRENQLETQDYLFNLPTTLFSGVYRVLQVA